MGKMTDYQTFIATSRYSRWLDDEGRRETWEESVGRYFDYIETHLKKNNNYELPAELRAELQTAVENLEVLPSMRAVMTAGVALDRCHVGAYNCSFVPVDHVRAFDETLYILMQGTGVGFSVEGQFVSKLPRVPEEFETTETCIVVGDSKEGWAKSLRELISLLWAGQIPSWDTSKVRPAGARLKTFGGRASGPEPLEDLLNFVVKTITGAAGRKLTPLECHDIMCKIGEVVVVGGVRRSAMISLSDLEDREMAKAKSGEFWNSNAQRSLANNSVAYDKKPSVGAFLEEWTSLYDSKSGERGIFNREAAVKNAKRFGKRKHDEIWGTNPCSEIQLRPNQFCNLTTIVVDENDDATSLVRKVRLATILGTFQASLTDFKYLRKIWRKNTEEERLLGVSMTGVFGNKLLSGQKGMDKLAEVLEYLRESAVDVNKDFAEALGINSAAAVTCIKPEGTTSQLTLKSSGLHAWHNDYYIRTVRGDNKDPMTQFMKDVGIPHEPDLMKPTHTTVFSFPVKAPEGAVTRNDMSALEHLELWLTYQRFWCEHKPSVTINVKEDEWVDVAAWVYDHFDEISGISFLPHSEHIYKQAPYQDITKEEYEKALAAMPENIDWSMLQYYESDDNTHGAQLLNCTGNSCEVVDLTVTEESVTI